jgi:hypothetical protein
LRVEHWIDRLKQVFKGPPYDAAWTDIDALTSAGRADIYKQYFFPQRLRAAAASDGELTGQIARLAESIITLVCEAEKLEAPGSSGKKGHGKEQRNTESAPLAGFFLMLCRKLTPAATLLGSSFGDRMFWFADQSVIVAHTVGANNIPVTPPGNLPGQMAGFVADTTCTVAHEMGHAQYLRHSMTSPTWANWVPGTRLPPPAGPAPAPVPPYNIRLYDSRQNNQIKDHDQARDHAFTCLMGYAAADSPIPKPCGVCNLTLRFYDRVKLQQPGNYEAEIMAGLSPASIVEAQANTNAGGEVLSWVLNEPDEPPAGHLWRLRTLHVTSVPQTIEVICVGPEREFQHFAGGKNAAGTKQRCRANISCADDRPQDLWKSSDNAIVRVQPTGGNPPAREHNRVLITAVARGTARVTYEKSGVKAEVEVEVQDP